MQVRFWVLRAVYMVLLTTVVGCSSLNGDRIADFASNIANGYYMAPPSEQVNVYRYVYFYSPTEMIEVDTKQPLVINTPHDFFRDEAKSFPYQIKMTKAKTALPDDLKHRLQFDDVKRDIYELYEVSYSFKEHGIHYFAGITGLKEGELSGFEHKAFQ